MNPNQRLVRKFELLQAWPADGCRAAMAIDQIDGTTKIVATELHFLGLARATSSVMERQPDGDEASTNSKSYGSVIVGILIENGQTTILNASSNFCGLAMTGQDISQCVGQASEAVLEKIKASAEQPSPIAKQSKP